MFRWLKRIMNPPEQPPPKPRVLFVIFGPNAAWVRVEGNEQMARWYVQNYRRVCDGPVSVSRVVGGREYDRVSVPADFDHTIPLFPLEDSAA